MPSVYSDLDSTKTSSQELVVNEAAVIQSIQNIFFTTVGQRFFNPTFGLDLDSILFELADEVTALNIEALIYGAVVKWDNRVVFDASKSAITPDPENNRFIVKLVYRIRGIENQVFNYSGFIVK